MALWKNSPLRPEVDWPACRNVETRQAAGFVVMYQAGEMLEPDFQSCPVANRNQTIL